MVNIQSAINLAERIEGGLKPFVIARFQVFINYFLNSKF